MIRSTFFNDLKLFHTALAYISPGRTTICKKWMNACFLNYDCSVLVDFAFILKKTIKHAYRSVSFCC
jgi:hypothetical protein